MQTITQISEQYDIPVSKIYRRAHILGIKPKRDGRNTYYTKEQVRDIITYKPPEKSFKSHRRKLTIIEFYQKYGSGNKVAYMLNIYRNFVHATIREYKETGYCIVESKMNKTCKN